MLMGETDIEICREREREFTWRRTQTTSREIRPLPSWNAISRDTCTIRGYSDYRFHVRPVPVFIANTCISAANRAARAQKSRKRRSESGRSRAGRAGGKVIKVLLNFAITRLVSKRSNRCLICVAAYL